MVGRDWEGPIAVEEETVVDIIETENPLSEDRYSELQTLIPNSQQECDDFGLEMFLQCRDFVVNPTLFSSTYRKRSNLSSLRKSPKTQMMINRAEKKSVYLNDAKLERYLRKFFVFLKTSFVPRINFITSYDQKVHGLERNRDAVCVSKKTEQYSQFIRQTSHKKRVYDDKLERKKSQKTPMMLN